MDNPSTPSVTRSDEKGTIPLYGYRIVNRYPHDPEAFTQGLMIADGYLYESTGLWGASTVRKVRLQTGEVVASVRLDPTLFGEGLTEWSNVLIQLTWRAGRALMYDRNDLNVLGEFKYEGEGWGITKWGSFLIMSNGSSELRFLDPSTFTVVRRVRVRDGNAPVDLLNELETVESELFANVWGSDWIAIISPEGGLVVGWVDLSGLRREIRGERRADVLNGIAYDPDGGRIYVTGKLWPELFEIELVPRAAHSGPSPTSVKSVNSKKQ
ncbi:MAG: glutaminyl-peptide cyclotransferase [Deltaproteobacteria bacterium]|nr:glutaminyl-peptide cyclotransferase [Deltaproteobacteria bacterium]